MLALIVGPIWIAGSDFQQVHRAPKALFPTRQVNVPNLAGVPFTPAVFWFGKVDPINNYTDVRADYYDAELQFYVHIIDQRLWYEQTPMAADLSNWDAVSIYLNLHGNFGVAPESGSYRFEIELDNNFRASYRGNGTSWVATSIPITSSTAWRGNAGPNSGQDSEGWSADFRIPFSSLGMVSAPAEGTNWGLAIVVHDRDDAAGVIHQDTSWPEMINPNVPSTWGLLSFGLPSFNTPPSMASGVVTIRQGLNGATITDGAVGGYTTCGNNGANKWTDWGNLNYSAPSVNYQFNIQNEWDISDWPCFSKYYTTFPLTSLPPGQSILSASLTMNLRGTAGGGQYGAPPNSYIEVLTVGQDWQPATLTWNNAPLAVENISGTWVPPVIGPYNWDVSRAVAQAYSAGGPLRLVLYSIDGDYNTGKYFYSSETTDWDGTVRPTLTVVYGQPCSAPRITCRFVYLPTALR